MVGFSSVIFCCLDLQKGHLFVVFKAVTILFNLALLAEMPPSFSISSSCFENKSVLLLGIRTLPHSLHVHFRRVITVDTKLKWITGLANSIYPKWPMHSFNLAPHVLHVRPGSITPKRISINPPSTG